MLDPKYLREFPVISFDRDLRAHAVLLTEKHSFIDVSEYLYSSICPVFTHQSFWELNFK